MNNEHFISTHILDTSIGMPASNVGVELSIFDGTNFKLISKGFTNLDGRFVFDMEKKVGTYRINFGVEFYFRDQKKECFFKDVPVIFEVLDCSRKYHVPLLLNPYGYSTYRGS